MRVAWLTGILLVLLAIPLWADDHGNSPLVATPLTVGGEPIEACIETPGDLDYFFFTAVAGRTYRLLTSHLSDGMDTVLYLFDSDGQSILLVDDDSGTDGGSRIDWTAPSGGIYFVMVRHALATSGTGCYAVSVAALQVDDNGDTTLTASPVSVGGERNGFLETEKDVDVFLFEAEAGYDYHVGVEITSGEGTARVALLDEDGGTVLAEGLASDDGLELEWTAGDSGTRFVEIQRSTGTGSLGYALRISLDGYGDDYANSASGAETLTPWDSSAAGRIEVSGDQDWFRFDAKLNGEYRLTLTPFDGGTLRVQLVGADGTTLLDRSASTPGSSIGFDWVAPSEGTYYIAVSTASGTASYTLRLDSTLQLASLGQFNPQGYTLDVKASGGYAYVVVGTKGLLIVDVSDPSHPIEVGSNSTRGYAQSVTIEGHFAYVANRGDGLTIIDVSDSMRPAEVGHLDTLGSAQAVAVNAGLAYVADQRGGLQIVDVTQPANPRSISVVETSGFAQSVWVSDGIAFVALGDAGLELVDVSDPAHPTAVGRLNLLGDAADVAVSDGLVYVAAGYRGVRIIDATDSSHPVEVGFVSTSGEATGIAVQHSRLYVAEGTGGFSVYDVEDPSDPKRLAQIDTPGSALKVWIDQDRAYVASREAGMSIIQLLP